MKTNTILLIVLVFLLLRSRKATPAPTPGPTNEQFTALARKIADQAVTIEDLQNDVSDLKKSPFA